MSVKIIIIGGVAGGATAAARARRLNEQAEIILFERGEFISFANCGLPYFIGEKIEDRDELLVTTVKDFTARYAIDIRNFTEVVSIDRKNKQVKAKKIITGESYSEPYDKIILSPGAEPIRPPLEGIDIDNIFTVRNIPDSDRIKSIIDSKEVESAVIVGGGFIGLEMAENLVERRVKVTVVEMLNQVISPIDIEMASIVHAHLIEKGVHLELGNRVKAFSQNGAGLIVSTASGADIACDIVILSIGIRPESGLAKEAGLALNERGGIIVDSEMKTSDPDIYAVGDAVEITDFVSGKPVMIPLAGPANKQGRIAADNAHGRNSEFKGALGTAVVKVFDLTVASTGQNEKSLKRDNIPYLKSYTLSSSHATYYPGSERMTIKLLFTPDKGKLLGAQIIGKKGVDKRIDVIATAIHGRMTVYDLEELELAYAPPFSSAKDPVNMAGYVGANILKGDVEDIHWDEFDGLNMDETVLVDLRPKDMIKKFGAVEGAMHIPANTLRDKLPSLDRSKTYILICVIGLRGYVGYRMMVQEGFKVKNFSGGHEIYKHTVARKLNRVTS